jgi:hypothetical protein
MTHQHESYLSHPPLPFGKDFSQLGSIRRAIRQRRIASVGTSRRFVVPLSEVERVEAAGRSARLACFRTFLGCL